MIGVAVGFNSNSADFCCCSCCHSFIDWFIKLSKSLSLIVCWPSSLILNWSCLLSVLVCWLLLLLLLLFSGSRSFVRSEIFQKKKKSLFPGDGNQIDEWLNVVWTTDNAIKVKNYKFGLVVMACNKIDNYEDIFCNSKKKKNKIWKWT